MKNYTELCDIPYFKDTNTQGVQYRFVDTIISPDVVNPERNFYTDVYIDLVDMQLIYNNRRHNIQYLKQQLDIKSNQYSYDDLIEYCKNEMHFGFNKKIHLVFTSSNGRLRALLDSTKIYPVVLLQAKTVGNIWVTVNTLEVRCHHDSSLQDDFDRARTIGRMLAHARKIQYKNKSFINDLT